MADPMIWLLGSIVIGGAGLTAGRVWGASEKVGEKTCRERRDSLTTFLEVKFKSIEDKLDDLKNKD